MKNERLWKWEGLSKVRKKTGIVLNQGLAILMSIFKFIFKVLKYVRCINNLDKCKNKNLFVSTFSFMIPTDKRHSWYSETGTCFAIWQVLI